MIRSRWTRRNLLIRRVQRHADVSALFGSATPLFERMPSRPKPGQGAVTRSLPVQTSARLSWGKPVPVVTAWLAPTPAPGEGEYWGTGETESQPTASVFPPQEQLTPGPQQAQAAKPVRAEAITGPRRVQESPEAVAPGHPQPEKNPIPPSPTPAEPLQGGLTKQAEDSPRTDESTWKRLQTIFRKHEEKRREEEAGKGEQPQLAALEQTPESQPREAGATAVRSPDEKSSPELKPATRQEFTSEEIAKSPPNTVLQRQPGAQEDEIPPKAPGIPEKRSVTQELPAKEAPVTSDLSPGKGTGISTGGIAARESDTGEDRPVESDLAEKGFDQEPVRKAVIQSQAEPQEVKDAGAEGLMPEHETREKVDHPVRKDNIVPGTPSTMKPVEQSPLEIAQTEPQISQPLQPRSLEEAWPVQRQATDRTHAEAQVLVPEEAIPDLLDQDEHAQVREALREVSPGQPTDSTVEVITPRRRRPPSPVLQEKEKPVTLSQPPASAPEMVQSEIGPLPSDLWELIGESPEREISQAKPAEIPAASGEIVQPGSEGFEETDGLREQAPIQMKKSMSTSSAIDSSRVVSTPQKMSTLQAMSAARATGEAQEMRISEQPSDAADSSAGQAADTGAAKSTPELDMDELAARVYGEVKRRLAVEWERLRRRF